MQKTTTTYNRLMALSTHWFEPRIVVKNNSGAVVGTIPESDIFSASTDLKFFRDGLPSVGSCIAAELDAEFYMPAWEIPTMARLEPQVLIHATENGEDVSDTVWLPKGVFFVDTREIDTVTKKIRVHGFDAMLKTEDIYPQTQASSVRDIAMVATIANAIGVSVDSRNAAIMTRAYTFPNPFNGFTMREVLEMIAGAYCGNFIITDDGKLRLVTLNELPPETRYLIANDGYAITFGGDHILV